MENEGKLVASPDFWNNAIGGLVSLAGMFNYKGQQNELAIAQAKADAARYANAGAGGQNNPYIIQVPGQNGSNGNDNKNNTLLYVIIGVIFLAILFLMFKSKK